MKRLSDRKHTNQMPSWLFRLSTKFLSVLISVALFALSAGADSGGRPTSAGVSKPSLSRTAEGLDTTQARGLSGTAPVQAAPETRLPDIAVAPATTISSDDFVSRFLRAIKFQQSLVLCAGIGCPRADDCHRHTAVVAGTQTWFSQISAPVKTCDDFIPNAGEVKDENYATRADFLYRLRI
jgi:hypothetical protein